MTELISEQKRRSIDGHRKELARVKNVTVNAIDQAMVGNAKDNYIAFRRDFQDEAWAGCDVHHYLDDLQAIVLTAKQGSGAHDLTQDLLDKLDKDARLSSAVLEAIQDGMTRREARELLDQLAALEKTLCKIRSAALKNLEGDTRAEVAELVKKRNVPLYNGKPYEGLREAK